MATPFFLIVDDLFEDPRDGVSRYALGLLRAMVATAPASVDVIGVLSASTPPRDPDEIARLLPGLGETRVSRLSHRQLAAAWQHGITPRLGGLVHSPSMFAPLGRGRDQTVVTLHDTVPWADAAPGTPSASRVRAMTKRADRYAAAVVVPSHAVADQLAEMGLLGNRVRVIPGAATPDLVVPENALARRRAFGLPDRYLVSSATLDPHRGLTELLRAAQRLELPVVLLAGSDHEDGSLETTLAELQLAADQVRVLAALAVPDYAAVLAGAESFVEPSSQEGFGLDVLDAMTVGIPVVVTDDPALVELVVDAARIVPRGDELADGLYEALSGLVSDGDAARRLAIAGQDRARLYSWRSAAEKVWQLHADI